MRINKSRDLIKAVFSITVPIIRKSKQDNLRCKGNKNEFVSVMHPLQPDISCLPIETRKQKNSEPRKSSKERNSRNLSKKSQGLEVS